MRVPTVAVYTLATLATLDLSHEVQAAAPVDVPQSTVGNVVVPAATVTPAPVEAIAAPEMIVAQQFSDTSSELQPSSSGQVQYYQDYQLPTGASVSQPQVSAPASNPVPITAQAPVTAQTSPAQPPAAAPGNFPIDTVPGPAEPAPVRRPVANPNELGVVATDVQVIGAGADLQQIILETIDTQPGSITSRSQLQADVEAILDTGLFRDANVVIRESPTGFAVVFQVDPIVVRSLQLSGAQVLPLDVANQIFNPQFGTPINPEALRQGVQQVNRWYQTNGYTLARVLGLRPSAEGVLTLEVAEGVIGDINIQFIGREGQTVDDQGRPIQGRTREEFIRREIQLQPGQVFREDRARQDLQQLYRLGLFENVNIGLGGDAQQVNLTYELTEAPARSVNVGGGYNEDTGIFGTVSYRDQNVGGVNQQLGVNVQASRRDVQFESNFTSPYRASDPDSLGYNINAFRRRGISQVFDDEIPLATGERPREGRFGGGVTVNRPLGEWQATAGLNYTRVSLRDREGNVVTTDVQGNPLSFSGTGIDDLTTVSFAATRDQRNNPFNPTEGSFLRLSTEQSVPVGSGNILMNRLQANFTQYVPVRVLDSGDGQEPEVLAFNLQGGTTIGDLPPYNAFTLGGTNSVRGYREGDVGTGRSFVLASAEYRFPIFTTPIGGVLFADFASDLGSGDTVLGEPGVVRGKPGTGFGYGAGVRVRSPIGIIRADYGFNDSGEGRIQVGIGQKF